MLIMFPLISPCSKFTISLEKYEEHCKVVRTPGMKILKLQFFNLILVENNPLYCSYIAGRGRRRGVYVSSTLISLLSIKDSCSCHCMCILCECFIRVAFYVTGLLQYLDVNCVNCRLRCLSFNLNSQRSSYYSRIIPDSFNHLLFQKLFRHNVHMPINFNQGAKLQICST